MTTFIIILIILAIIILDQTISHLKKKHTMIKNGTWIKKCDKGLKNHLKYFINKVRHLTWVKVKKFLLGRKFTDGFFFKLMIYTLLVSISYVYIYPLLYMISTSLKSPQDIINPMVSWVPTSLYVDNYVKAFKVLKFFPTLGKSLLITLIPAIIETIVSSIIGYGFAKFNFKYKKFWFILVILTFLVPSAVYMIPKYVMFYKMKILNSPLAIILPAFFGQGLNSAIFILIFYQFFRMIPTSIDEAAEIDGAGPYKRFFSIGIPLASPAFITSFLFSLVWYWNETSNLSLFVGEKASILSLQIRLANFEAEYNTIYATTESIALNEGIYLAATLLIILPMLLVYFSLQRFFVEGIERTGITGE